MRFSITLEKHIESLRNYVARTDHKYAINYQQGRDVHPIPFFGNINTAEILTVGANPSNTEFLDKRQWPKEIDTIYLMNRLMNYFNYPEVVAHDWFEKWQKALRHLNRSYSDGTAAHIDLSPRATLGLKSLNDENNYNKMAEEDVKWFFSLLNLCDKVKLILIAGTIPKGYINKFLEDHSDENSFKWMFACKIKKGHAFTSSHKLKFKDKTYPIFYCSSGPSDTKNPGLFIERIDENKDRLLNYLEAEF